jgi:hypothetical protein
MSYVIYKEINLADTWRDTDNIVKETLAYKNNFNDALSFGYSYIKNNFLKKDTKFHKYNNINNYRATDFCSYGETVYIDEIKIT